MATDRLGVGFIGSGFITRFHIRSWTSVRDADVRGIWSPDAQHAKEAAALARELRVGEAEAFDSIEAMVQDPAIDAIWICGPNFSRVENLEAVLTPVRDGTAELIGVACEKPLGRTVAEANRMVGLVEEAGVLHGYLEDQLFAPGLQRGREILWKRGAALAGRPYLARAAEEHSGPHAAWFWQGALQGGGVLLDMMCHSVEVARFLLTAPDAPRSSITPTKVSAQVATLKWNRPSYARQLRERFGPDVDFDKRPVEDFARATITYADEEGRELISETTTSWSYVGPGLRLRAELLGPEYSLRYSSLDSGVDVYLSRAVQGAAGEDLVEKQNAEQGLLPVIGDEAAAYGYTGENQHFTRCFLDGRQPALDFHAGREVVRLLMAAYMSAEQERTLTLPAPALETFVPRVAQGPSSA
ncbi:MAG: Gfo/Idh/MocA family oxidoreductase [Bacteroidetes bacterium]|jgi:predicted dehydrogenase|nr:Gfo/Idh/MocA family oxidoreductase [Bacteroidota bacterium]